MGHWLREGNKVVYYEDTPEYIQRVSKRAQAYGNKAVMDVRMGRIIQGRHHAMCAAHDAIQALTAKENLNASQS